eukprot:gene8209-5734_t
MSGAVGGPREEVAYLLQYIQCALMHPRPLPSGPHTYYSNINGPQEMIDLYHCVYKLYKEVAESTDFREPVDALAYGVFHYYEKIKNPMSLHEVLDHIASGTYYRNIAEAEADIELIWTNAELFNGAGHPVTNNAERCRAALAELRERLENEKQPPESEVNEVMVEIFDLAKQHGDLLGELEAMFVEQWPHLVTEDGEIKSDEFKMVHLKKIKQLRDRYKQAGRVNDRKTRPPTSEQSVRTSARVLDARTTSGRLNGERLCKHRLTAMINTPTALGPDKIFLNAEWPARRTCKLRVCSVRWKKVNRTHTWKVPVQYKRRGCIPFLFFCFSFFYFMINFLSFCSPDLLLRAHLYRFFFVSYKKKTTSLRGILRAVSSLGSRSTHFLLHYLISSPVAMFLDPAAKGGITVSKATTKKVESPSCAPHSGRYIGMKDRAGVPLFLGPFGGVFAFVPGSNAPRHYMQAYALRELGLTEAKAEELANEEDARQAARVLGFSGLQTRLPAMEGARPALCADTSSQVEVEPMMSTPFFHLKGRSGSDEAVLIDTSSAFCMRCRRYSCHHHQQQEQQEHIWIRLSDYLRCYKKGLAWRTLLGIVFFPSCFVSSQHMTALYSFLLVCFLFPLLCFAALFGFSCSCTDVCTPQLNGYSAAVLFRVARPLAAGVPFFPSLLLQGEGERWGLGIFETLFLSFIIIIIIFRVRFLQALEGMNSSQVSPPGASTALPSQSMRLMENKLAALVMSARELYHTTGDNVPDTPQLEAEQSDIGSAFGEPSTHTHTDELPCGGEGDDATPPLLCLVSVCRRCDSCVDPGEENDAPKLQLSLYIIAIILRTYTPPLLLEAFRCLWVTLLDIRIEWNS